MVQNVTSSESTQHDQLETFWPVAKTKFDQSTHCAFLSRNAFSRQILEVGAVCVSSARTDLHGGCRVTGISTVTNFFWKKTCVPLCCIVLWIGYVFLFSKCQSDLTRKIQTRRNIAYPLGPPHWTTRRIIQRCHRRARCDICQLAADIDRVTRSNIKNIDERLYKIIWH